MNDIFHLICLPATDKGAIEAKIGKIDTYFHRHTDRQLTDGQKLRTEEEC